MNQSYLNILIQLARIDGVIVQDEIDLIKKIGKLLGLNSDEISRSFNDPNLEVNFNKMNTDENFYLLYLLVKLMKIDGRLYKEEINFCSKIASKIGYDQTILLELMLKINTKLNGASQNEEIEHLKKVTKKYLLN